MPTDRELSQLAARLYEGSPAGVRLTQRYRPRICPFQPLLEQLHPGMRLLDIGCGSGLFAGLAAILRGPLDIFGVDVSRGAIEAARRMAQQDEVAASGSRVNFLAVEDTGGWPRELFDAVSMIDVLHHVPRREQRGFVLEAYSRVKPGGRLLYKDMVSAPLWRVAANQMHDLVLARQWVRTAPLDEVRRWLETAGARILGTSRENRLWYGHEFLFAERRE